MSVSEVAGGRNLEGEDQFDCVGLTYERIAGMYVEDSKVEKIEGLMEIPVSECFDRMVSSKCASRENHMQSN